VLILLLAGCNQTSNSFHKPTTFDTLSDYFKTRQEFALDKKVKTVFILTEYGCIPCNRKFSSYIKENVNNDSVLFLITASGSMVDITPYESNERNIFYDQNMDIEKYPIFKMSKAIYLKNNIVDTIISLSADQLESQMEYIKNRK
jgi:hypothetical protein